MGVGLLVLVVAVYGAASWYFSDQLKSGMKVSALSATTDTSVVAVTDSTVTLDPTGGMPEGLKSTDVYGLAYDGGYAQLTDLVGSDQTTVTRGFLVLTGQPPAVGQQADVQKQAFPADPSTFLGAAVSEVSITSPAGDLPAWYAPGTSTTWAVLVHGNGTTRSEMFRLMQVTTGQQMPSLDISFRGDPENGGGLPTFGATEWPDLQAGVQYAVDNGAEHVVLVGASMGGSIVAAFLERSDLAPYVTAVVLDSPALDYAATVRYQASHKTIPVLGTSIPSFLVSSAIWLGDVRFGLDPGATNYLNDTSWLTVPALVFAGTDDPSVPSTDIVQRLAAAQPDLVDAVYVQGAWHVESWNHDPTAYDQQVQAFLGEHS